jgi:hypothetical protein
MDGDPDRLLIIEDLEAIRAFGALQLDQAKNKSVASLVKEFTRHCFEKLATADQQKLAQLNSHLTRIAEEWSEAWVDVARFRQAIGMSAQEVDFALRKAVEERPFDKTAWTSRAEFARNRGDDTTMIAALISAVDVDPSDLVLLRETAFELCKYIDAHKEQIPPIRRGVYLASVRSHMINVADELEPNGLSRLAWLFLLEGDLDGAWKYASKGLEIDQSNTHCLKIVEKLHYQGYVANP